MLYTDGSVYEGEWDQDLRHGEGKVEEVDKSWVKALWENGEIKKKT